MVTTVKRFRGLTYHCRQHLVVSLCVLFSNQTRNISNVYVESRRMCTILDLFLALQGKASKPMLCDWGWCVHHPCYKQHILQFPDYRKRIAAVWKIRYKNLRIKRNDIFRFRQYQGNNLSKQPAENFDNIRFENVKDIVNLKIQQFAGFLVWWRWRELNPRPKDSTLETLRA